MTEPATGRTILRSIGAVAAGMVLGIVVTLITDFVLHAVGFYPPSGQPAGDGPLVGATIYRAICEIGASYVIALLAPNRPMMRGLIGGAIGLVVSAIGAIVPGTEAPPSAPTGILSRSS